MLGEEGNGCLRVLQLCEVSQDMGSSVGRQELRGTNRAVTIVIHI